VGNLASTTTPRGSTTRRFWRPTRKLTTTLLPFTPQGTPAITNTYDRRDWLSKTLDPLQQATLFTNDASQRLVSRTDPLLRRTRFAYDARLNCLEHRRSLPARFRITMAGRGLIP
jgi:YD repeat-containing protein